MQSILIPVTGNNDINAIMAFIAKLGIKAIVIDESATRMKMRKEIAMFSKKIHKTDISDSEITGEINAYREEKNAGE
ncbi:MAG: hypothetical protein HY958_12670 [Bacteroidia bacterium]|nr:hypothetical protein [Bacteroidia bacterium]